MVYRPTERVLAVLELLQTHGQLTANELAAKLEVDPRTVRRYVTTLQDIGVPIEAELGQYGGYTLRPGFKLPPLMFTNAEILVLTLGLHWARKTGIANARTAAKSALAKIERVLPVALRDTLRALDKSTQVDESTEGAEINGELLMGLSVAISQRQQVRISYQSREKITERDYDPYAVICYQERWYTVGYCHLRHELRTFRLDRLCDLIPLNKQFTPPMNFDAMDYMLSSFEAIPDRWNIDVLLDMPLDQVRARIPREMATLVQTAQGIRLRSSIRDLNDMAHRLIALACPIKIINPPELRAEFLSIAQQITRYANDAGN
jgi:predicted DNA-binding transcriptional regulator YafY